MSKALSSWFGLSLCTLGYLYATSNTVLAQVTSDGTVNTQVTENGNTAEITGGETRGDNLFHSFQDFSVPTGNEASFLNANDISNIFSRVTGGDISNIDGLISANGSANLFLINPAGIVFGEGARLDIGGSFYGSSASSILFEDGEFSATDLDNPPLLTINAPIGLGFRDQPGDIVNNSVANNGRGLEVSPGNNISLLGGNVNFDGGRIFAPGGTVNLGGLTTAGTLGFADDGNLSFSDNTIKADVSLTNNAVVDITSDGGGLIAVNANNLELTQESRFLADIGKGLGSVNAVAGTIDIDASRIVANSNSIIQAANLGIGKAGTININTDILNFKGGSAIVASNFGQREAGVINVNAQEISFDREWGGIYANTGLQRIQTEPFVSEAIGNAGEININTDTLKLTDGAQLQVSSVAQGDAGIININATGSVSFANQGKTNIPEFNSPAISGSFAAVRKQGVGDAGRANIKADSLTLSNKGAVITNNDAAEGKAGDIIIDIENNIDMDQEALILSQITSSESAENGGDINITSSSFKARGESQISTDNFNPGTGSGGDINIQADQAISLDEGTKVLTENGGNISLTGGEFNLANESEIIAKTDIEATDTDNISDITIDVTGNINLSNGTQIQTQLFNNGTGKAGDITIKTGGSLFSTNGNLILADSQAKGNGGNITITAREKILLEGLSQDEFPSQIFAGLSKNAEGTGGNIVIKAGELVLKDVAFISSNTVRNSIGSPGNISINVDRLQLTENAFINTLTSNNSDAGEITINAQTLDLLSGGKILAATDGGGKAGNINLNINDDIKIDNSIKNSAQSVNFKDISPLLDRRQSSPSGIYADTTENVTGSGGSIFIDSNSLSLNGGATISAATNFGQGGNLTIDSNFIVAFPNQNNDIIANAKQGNGGNITINAESVFGIEKRPLNDFTNDINASSEFALDGSVNIDTSDINPVQGATELPSNVVEPEQTTAQTCESGRGTANNGLAIAGKGGVPPAPDTPLNSENIISSEQNPAAFAIPQPIETSKGKIQPARGIKVSKSGKISLTAYRTNNAGERIPEIKPNCN